MNAIQPYVHSVRTGLAFVKQPGTCWYPPDGMQTWLGAGLASELLERAIRRQDLQGLRYVISFGDDAQRTSAIEFVRNCIEQDILTELDISSADLLTEFYPEMRQRGWRHGIFFEYNKSMIYLDEGDNDLRRSLLDAVVINNVGHARQDFCKWLISGAGQYRTFRDWTPTLEKLSLLRRDTVATLPSGFLDVARAGIVDYWKSTRPSATYESLDYMPLVISWNCLKWCWAFRWMRELTYLASEPMFMDDCLLGLLEPSRNNRLPTFLPSVSEDLSKNMLRLVMSDVGASLNRGLSTEETVNNQITFELQRAAWALSDGKYAERRIVQLVFGDEYPPERCSLNEVAQWVSGEANSDSFEVGTMLYPIVLRLWELRLACDVSKA